MTHAPAGPAGGAPMSVEQAVLRLLHWAPVDGSEGVSLCAALSRVLAEDLVASQSVPPHDNSAMDGFAIRFADIGQNRHMQVAGRVRAGHPMSGRLPYGKAVQIFTGAPMPDGADTVALQEQCVVHGDVVVLPQTLAEGANRRRAGEDVAPGDVVLKGGRRLRPQDIGMAAAIGLAGLRVRRHVRVAVLSTGDELRAPGQALPAGCIHDSNRPMIVAALQGLGAAVTDIGLVPDRLGPMRVALAEAAARHDLVISSGGVSAGAEDHVRPAMMDIGTLDFWKLAIRPGKPIAVGRIGQTAFVGLPGNPVAAMVAFTLIARPLILRLMGLSDLSAPTWPVVAGFHHRHAQGRNEYLRVCVTTDNAGRACAEKYPFNSSGMLSSLVQSEGLAVVPAAHGDVAAGDVLSYYPYAGLLA